MLNPDGPFVLLNPTMRLPSGETQVLNLSFSPRESILVSPSPPELYCSPTPCSTCPHPTWSFHSAELHERWEQEHFLVCSNQPNERVPKPLQVGGRRVQTLCK